MANWGVNIAPTAGIAGTLNVGPLTLGSSSMTVWQNLGIGATYFNTASGHADMNVGSSGIVNIVGRVDVGNPGGDQGCTLPMLQGGTMKVSGGLRVWSTSGGALDLRGGLFHLIGGAMQWPSARQLVVSSQVGTPELWITNGVANTGPSAPGIAPQFIIGRGGSGLLRVTRPGTNFICGNGPTVLGDSLAGLGRISVDSSGTFTTTGYTVIGNAGNGQIDILHGGNANLGAAYLSNGGTSSGVGGTLYVNGAGSTCTVHDLFAIGGHGGSLGLGYLVMDSSATMNVITSGILNPPSFDIYSGTGQVYVSNGAVLSTTAGINHSGSMTLRGGEIDAALISMGSAGSIRGWGKMVSPIQSSGRIEPYSAADSFGVQRVTGTFQQSSPGRYVVNLGTGPGPRCDTLVISGAATLGGTLELRLDPTFIHTVGDTFTVLTCGSRTGVFSSVTWHGSPLTGQAQVVYTPNAVKIAIGNGIVGVEPSAGSAPSELRFAASGPPNAAAILLELPMAAEVDVKLYDIAGRTAAHLFTGPLGVGEHRFELSGVGARLASGTYFARATVHMNGTTFARTVRTMVLR